MQLETLKNKRTLTIAGAVVVVLLILLLVLPHLLNADNYRGNIESALSSSLGRPVQLGHLDLSLLSGSLVAAGLQIGDDPAFSSQPFLTAKDIRIGVEVLPLVFHKELHITGLTIDTPAITLLRRADGVWNYSSLGGSAKQPAPATASNPLPNLTVSSIDIKGGTLTVGAVPAQVQPRVYSDVDISAEKFSFTNAFPFSVSGNLPAGGSLEVKGTAGPINPADASRTPLTADISLKHADLVGAGLVEAAQGVGGVADLTMKVSSNGQAAQVSGTLHLADLRLARNGSPSKQPVDVDFAVNQDLQALSGTLTSANVHLGKAALNLAGTYQTTGNATSVQMNATGDAMPIDDLEAFLPSLGIALPAGSRVRGGTLALKLNASGPTTAIVVSGPLRIENAQLAGFDLGSKLSAVQALTGAKTGSDTTVQLLSTNLRYAPDGIRTDNLDAVVSGLGSATGSGTISPAGALNYHLTVKLGGAGGSAQPLSVLTGALGSAMGAATKGGIPVAIGGTTSNPTFTPEMGKMVGGVTNGAAPASKQLGKALSGLLHH